MKAAHDYTALDAAILTALEKNSPMSGDCIFCGDVFVECVRATVAAQADGFKVDRWSIFAGRMQALRRSGKIAYSRKHEGWSLINTGSAS